MVIQTVMSTAKAMVMDWRFPRLREKAKDWLRKRGMARDWLIPMLTVIQMERLTATRTATDLPTRSLRDFRTVIQRGLMTAKDSPIPRWTVIPMERLRARARVKGKYFQRCSEKRS